MPFRNMFDAVPELPHIDASPEMWIKREEALQRFEVRLYKHPVSESTVQATALKRLLVAKGIVTADELLQNEIDTMEYFHKLFDLWERQS